MKLTSLYLLSYKRIWFIAIVVCFRIVLDIAYYYVIVPTYSYTGLIYDANTYNIGISYGVLILTAIILTVRTDKISLFVPGFLYLVSYVPATSLFALGGFSFTPFLWLTLVFVFLFMLNKVEIRINIKSFYVKSPWPIVATSIFVYVSFIALIAKHGIRIPQLNMSNEIYNLRSEFDSSGNSILSGYFLGWLAGIVVPFFIGFGFLKRNWALFLLGLFSQLEIFAIAGNKSHLFSIFLVLWFIVAIKLFKHNLIHALGTSFLLFSFLILAFDLTFGIFMADALFTRRVFFVPAQLYYYYWDFFSKNAHTYLSETNIFSWLVQYPYDLPVAKLIGYNYLDSAEANANANMWASAFASLGIAGMFLFAFVLHAFMKCIDYLAANKDIYYVYILLAMPIFGLTNGSLLTNMLTNGMLLSVLLIALLPRTQSI